MAAAWGTWGNTVCVLKAGDLCILAAHTGKASDVDQVLQTEETADILQFGTGVCLVHPIPGLCISYRGRRKIRVQFSIKFSMSKHFDFFVFVQVCSSTKKLMIYDFNFLVF